MAAVQLRENQGSASRAQALPLSMEIERGRGYLIAKSRRIHPLCDLDQLRLEIPALKFPFTLGDGDNPLASARTRIDIVRALTSEQDASHFLTAALAKVSPGTDAWLSFGKQHVDLLLRLEPAEGPVELCLRLGFALEDVDGRHRIRVAPLRAFALGNTAAPVSVLLADLWRAWVSSEDRAPFGPQSERDLLWFEPLRLVAEQVASQRGWKLPGEEGLRRFTAHLRGREVLWGAQSDGRVPAVHDERDAYALLTEDAGRWQEAWALGAQADEAAISGDYEQARQLFETQIRRLGPQTHWQDRLLDLLCAMNTADATAEARQRARERLARLPSDLVAISALLRLADRDGDRTTATQLRAKLLDLAQVEQDSVLEVGCHLAIARSLSRSDLALSAQHVDAARTIAPGLRCIHALRRELARRAGDTIALRISLESEIASTTDRETRIGRTVELAELFAYELGDLSHARVLLDRVLETSPSSAATWRLRGDVDAKLDRPLDAVRAFERAATLCESAEPEQSAADRVRAAELWMGSLHEPRTAESHLRKALLAQPRNADACRLLSRILISESRLDEALGLHAATNELVGLGEPREGELTRAAWYDLKAELEAARGHEDEARAMRHQAQNLRASEAVRQTTAPQQTPASAREAAQLAREAGDGKKAIELLLAAEQQEPFDSGKARLWTEIASLYDEVLEDDDAAWSAVMRALDLDERALETTPALLMLVSRQAPQRGALARGAEALALLARTAEQDVNRGMQLTQAADWLYQARPDDPRLLGWTADALQAAPTMLSAYAMRARILSARGQFADAIATLRRALAIEESEPLERAPHARMAAELLMQTGDADAAISILLDMRASTTADGASERLLLKAREQAGRFAELRDEATARAAQQLGQSATTPLAVWKTLQVPPADISRELAADALAQAARYAARMKDSACIEWLAQAERFGAYENALTQARIAVGRATGDHAMLSVALRAMAAELLDPAEAERLIGEAELAERKLKPKLKATPKPVQPPPMPAAPERNPTAAAARTSARLEQLAEGVTDARKPAAAPTATGGPANTIAELDRMVEAGQRTAAIEQIDELLRATRTSRDSAIRRSLLLRKGRWLLDEGTLGRDVTLALTGALILDDSSAETRFELFRAYTLGRDARGATEQLRSLFDALRQTPQAVEHDRIVKLMLRLEQLDRAPDFGQQLELASEASPSLAAALRQAAPRSAKG
jgi:hypothetical protein